MIKRETTEEPVSIEKNMESQTGGETKRQRESETSVILPATELSASDNFHELKAKRLPLRKYIRKVGKPGHEQTVVEVVEQKPKEITLAALKAKFGLTDSKIGGIIRDAEKFGKSRRVMNPSYVSAQD